MGRFWMKVWIWTKVIVFFLVFVYGVVFIVKNLDNSASVWYSYGNAISTNTLKLALYAFLAGVVCTILIRTTFVTIRQFRQVKERNRHEKLQRDVEEMKAKASLLQPRPSGDKTAET